MQMEFLGFTMLQSLVFPFFKRQPGGGWQQALLNIIRDKQRAAERGSLAGPQGTDRGVALRTCKGTQLAFTLTMPHSANPVPFDPALSSNRSEHACLASLMHIILSGQ